tara:strand:- start:1808 stop:2140 length:333 start_codon:yes stop_codon:yes gene_type:complete
MAKKSLELKLKDASPILKFVNWYGEHFSTPSKTGRVMKGKSNDFIINFLEHLLTGNKIKVGEDMEKINMFVALKDKSQEEIDAEKAFKNDAEKLKTWKQLQKDIARAKKG